MTWQAFYTQYINADPGIGQIALRLLCAMIVGALIGLEREYTHRPAGLRTHILVALGACVVSVLGEMLFTHYAALGASPDPARLSAQVITGVGFLGAGTIMKEGVSVKGLTTAASVWAVACLGIAAGFGYYALAIAGMLFTLVTLTIFEGLQRKLVHTHSTEASLDLFTQNLGAALEQLHHAAKEHKVTLFDLTTERHEDGYRVHFRAWLTGRKSEQRRGAFFAQLAQAKDIQALRHIGRTEVHT